MYLIGQVFIYLALALIIGGAIGYAFRACLADTACDDVRDELARVTARNNALMESQAATQMRLVVAPVSNPAPAFPSAPFRPREGTTELAYLNAKDLEAALLKAAPGVSVKTRFGADDLTAIKGITPVIDVWLGLNGITRFSQIAQLRANELYWLVENLPHDGASVYRDQWVSQAAKLDG